MTLEDINYVAQTIGVTAILGSLIAIIIQMHQSAAAAKVAAAEEVHRRFSEVYLALSGSPTMSEIYVKANQDYGSLSPAERYQYLTAAMALWINTQEAHRKWTEGSLGDDRWRLWDGLSKLIFAGPASGLLWAERKHLFSDSFQAYVNKIRTDAPHPILAERTQLESPSATTPR